MTHIFGFEHTLSGIAGQVFNNPFGFGTLGSNFGMGGPLNGTPVLQPTTGVFGNGGNGNGTPPTVLAAGASCEPGRKAVGVLYRDANGTICIKPYKRRKRKRRLASASDIKDLSALKTVLSAAQVNTWLATRGR